MQSELLGSSSFSVNPGLAELLLSHSSDGMVNPQSFPLHRRVPHIQKQGTRTIRNARGPSNWEQCLFFLNKFKDLRSERL